VTKLSPPREVERFPGHQPIARRSGLEYRGSAGVGEQQLDHQRQADDQRRAKRAYQLEAAFWAVMGAIVVLCLFFAVLGAVNPVKAPAATFVMIVVALIWLIHAWERLYAGGHVSRSDRERRGF
jgi:hypothetical protein